jgi:hypothetical protein
MRFSEGEGESQMWIAAGNDSTRFGLRLRTLQVSVFRELLERAKVRFPSFLFLVVYEVGIAGARSRCDLTSWWTAA